MTSKCPECPEYEHLERMPDGYIKCDNCGWVGEDKDLAPRED